MGQADSTKKTGQSLNIGDDILLELSKIRQAINLHSKILAKRTGITGAQMAILKRVANSDPVTVGNIAKDANLSIGTTSGILERLERRKLLVRKKSEEDRRRVEVELTPEGKELMEKALPLLNQTFQQRLERLQPWEQTMILSSLQHLSNIMDTKP